MVVVQSLAPPVALIDVTTFPPPSNATQNDVDRHDTPKSWPVSPVSVLTHEFVPALGSVKVKTSPKSGSSVATHSDTDGHEIPLKTVPGLAVFQALAPPVGSVAVTVFSPKSNATHSDPAGSHDTPSRGLVPSTFVGVQALAPPVGSVEVTTFPSLSTATHNDVDNDVDEHDTPLRALVSTFVVVHALAPPVGSVDVTTFPLLSTATHNAVEEHDTPVRALLPSTSVVVQAPPPPPGSVEVTTFPLLSTATHSDADGHDTPLMAFGDPNGAW